MWKEVEVDAKEQIHREELKNNENSISILSFAAAIAFSVSTTTQFLYFKIHI